MSTQLIKPQLNCIRSATKVNELCQPLFSITPIANYSLSRIYSNGSSFTLSSNPDWLEYYYNNQLSGTTSIIQCPKLITRKQCFWRDLVKCSAVQLAATEFNIINGFTVINKNQSYIDLYHFCCNTDNDYLSSWYINNIDVLNHFNRYFADRVTTLELSTLKTKPTRLIHQQFNRIVQLNNRKEVLLAKHLKTFIRKTPIKHLQVYCNGLEVTLTQREVEVLTLLMHGCTAKKSAEMLYLSQRTIEAHLAKCKQKFNCHYKQELIDIVTHNAILS